MEYCSYLGDLVMEHCSFYRDSTRFRRLGDGVYRDSIDSGDLAISFYQRLYIIVESVRFTAHPSQEKNGLRSPGVVDELVVGSSRILKELRVVVAGEESAGRWT